ncbi:hypothetical protein POTOM_021446 [Populus tomentosa]|uniref:Uncharacterized protein n=1 Tax=Populus tomentosa TaxID=118781 RepID=A0A8X8D1E6_POPTO|nr:hypothetical protein POTOM_021446 [Populus tomentosa]
MTTSKERDLGRRMMTVDKNEHRTSLLKFSVIAMTCSFLCHFPTDRSGMRGLGIGALTLDWSTVAPYSYSRLLAPFFAIVNVFVGYALIMYVVVNDKFELDLAQYDKHGRVHLSTFFALTYGFGFATIAATLSHVALFYGREIYDRYRASSNGKEDIHTRLTRNYKDIPSWWFHGLQAMTLLVALFLCIFLKKEVQMPFRGLLFAAALAFIFSLPISIITATTNQAISFLSDFKLGHYMKIPPSSLEPSQLEQSTLGWLLNSVERTCQDNLLPAKIVLGLALVTVCSSMRLSSGVLLDLGESLAPSENTRPSTGSSWEDGWGHLLYRKDLWQRYNYVLSAALDAGVAFMAVLIYVTVGLENKILYWWGSDPDVFPEHCSLATCPTAKGISVDGCPTS